MSPAAIEAVEFARSTVDRVLDVCRQAAHTSHEARALKTIAQDAIEDGTHAARRALRTVKHRLEDLGDLQEEAIHRVKRQPLRAVGIAAAAGVVVGLAVGWMGSRCAFRRGA